VLLLQEQQMVVALCKQLVLEHQPPCIDLLLGFALGKAEKRQLYRHKQP
jgi:hypothetical protein